MNDYKLVPVEPTPEMLNAPLQGGRFENRVDLRPSIYRAMLAAAPDVQGEPDTHSFLEYPSFEESANFDPVPAVQGEPVAWMTTARVLGEGITTDKRHGEKWMKSHPSKTTPLYAAPQPVEKATAPKPIKTSYTDGVGACRRSPEDCRYGISYVTVADTVYWPLSADDAQRLRSAECGGGDFTGPANECPDVSGLVEALTELCDEIDKHEIHAAISKTSISWFKRKARKALAAHRKQQGVSHDNQ